MIIKKVSVSGYKNLNIDWDLSESGNIVALIGKNASGKTNLLEALMGFSNVADNSKSIKPNFKGEMELDTNLCTDVFLLKLVPGVSPDILDYLYDKGYKAVYITGDNSGVDSMAEDYINNKARKLAELIQKKLN